MTKTAYVPGTWDLFHYGHVYLLKRVAKLATRVIVGVNTDAAVAEMKGKTPVVPLKARMAVVGACRYVDGVEEREAFAIDVPHLKKLGVDMIVIGDDWKDKKLDGLDEAGGAGIEIVYLSYTKGVSTTAIKNKIRENR